MVGVNTAFDHDVKWNYDIRDWYIDTVRREEHGSNFTSEFNDLRARLIKGKWVDVSPAAEGPMVTAPPPWSCSNTAIPYNTKEGKPVIWDSDYEFVWTLPAWPSSIPKLVHLQFGFVCGGAEMDDVTSIVVDASPWISSFLTGLVLRSPMRHLPAGVTHMMISLLGVTLAGVKPRISVHTENVMQGHVTEWKAGVQLSSSLGVYTSWYSLSAKYSEREKIRCPSPVGFRDGFWRLGKGEQHCSLEKHPLLRRGQGRSTRPGRMQFEIPPELGNSDVE